MSRWGFLFDQTRCVGCNACQMACKDKNNLELGQFFRRVATYETVKDGKTFCVNYSGACNHCKDAACVKGCPTGAMHYREDGTVAHDDEKCIGCATCVWVCPYGAPSLSHKRGIALKCTSCVDLRREGKNPACVDACIMHCLEFVDLDELDAKSEEKMVRDLPFLPDSSLTDPSLRIIPKVWKRGER
ncbi:MAG: 4Fe-4S dicluster domain-containing protein [Clostridiales bacterium]|nr:4Fe-4S dicluster domain-containing protein [Clostridiales bacterium]